MTFGLYLFFTFVMFLFFGLWLRSLVVRRLKPDRILRDIQEELNALMSDLNSAGDRHVTLLEDRINTLQRLITDADQQIDMLRQVVTYIQEDLARDVRDAAPQNDREATSTSTLEGANTEIAPAAQPPEPVADTTRPQESAVDAVRRLAEFGVSTEMIAQQTGIAVGEVELIISLQKGHSWR